MEQIQACVCYLQEMIMAGCESGQLYHSDFVSFVSSCYIECEELCIDMFQLDPELIAGIMVVMTGVVDRCLAHAAV